MLFKQIEVILLNSLQKHLQRMAPNNTKDKLITAVVQSKDVQCYWYKLSIDIHNEKWSQELLAEIFEVWLSVTGNSIADQCIDYYKNCTTKSTRKSKSLRKQLKEE